MDLKTQHHTLLNLVVLKEPHPNPSLAALAAHGGVLAVDRSSEGLGLQPQDVVGGDRAVKTF